MEIVSDIGHRALAYAAAVQDRGYFLTVEELEAFFDGPGQGIVYAGMPGVIHRTDRYREYSPHFEPESAADWFERLGWAYVTGERVAVTELGLALLRHLDTVADVSDAPVEIVLDPADELAYARVIGRIARHGEALLVDPYFTFEHLWLIVQQTEVTRILTGENGKARIAGLVAALHSLKVDRPEVRTAGTLHDRYVVPAKSGPVDLLGTSLNGVGRRLSTMVQLSESVGDVVRRQVEKAWESATPLLPPPDAGDGAEG